MICHCKSKFEGVGLWGTLHQPNPLLRTGTTWSDISRETVCFVEYFVLSKQDEAERMEDSLEATVLTTPCIAHGCGRRKIGLGVDKWVLDQSELFFSSLMILMFGETATGKL